MEGADILPHSRSYKKCSEFSPLYHIVTLCVLSVSKRAASFKGLFSRAELLGGTGNKN